MKMQEVCKVDHSFWCTRSQAVSLQLASFSCQLCDGSPSNTPTSTENICKHKWL